MARGKRKITLEERLTQIENEITELTEHLTELKEEKKQVIQAIREKEINELYEVVKASGKSIVEVKEMLAGSQDQSE